MGYWEATDAITSSPIWDDEDVYMVVLTEEGMKTTDWDDPGNAVFWDKLIEGIYEGKYSHSGWIKDLPLSYQISYEINPWQRSLFIRKRNWDQIVEYRKQQGKLGCLGRWPGDRNYYEGLLTFRKADELVKQYEHLLTEPRLSKKDWISDEAIEKARQDAWLTGPSDRLLVGFSQIVLFAHICRISLSSGLKSSQEGAWSQEPQRMRVRMIEEDLERLWLLKEDEI